MEVVAKSNSRRMYSWWWDSHNTPTNSKWLRENLADMDSNVKKMIKVLEEDGESFSKRAEMYYHKRPELLKLVEEFYRQFRALAERYNHATNVIHEAHQTIAEAFPDQVPSIFGDDDADNESLTPHMPEPLSVTNSGSKARRGLDFSEGKNDLKERASKAEAEVVALKESLAKIQAEKEVSLAQFEKNFERLSYLESEVSRAEEYSKVLKDKAVTAEAEIQTLKETIEKLESEKESNLVEYNETISNVEGRLRKAEEDLMLINERVVKSETEVKSLKEKFTKLTLAKEASELQYQQCLNIIAGLKLKLYSAQEETLLLISQVEEGVAKLNFSEEKCNVLERSNENLHSELDTLLEKLGNQSEKLTEKQTEIVKLWSRVHEEHLRFQEAETAFQTLQRLHAQSQEELNEMALELQTGSEIMNDMEIRNNGLYEEVTSMKSLQEDVSNLKETIRKLEGEVKLRVDERNDLQEQVYRLSEDENSNSTLKVEMMEELVEKNVMLEKSISDLKFEMESARRKLKMLEEGCVSLSEENWDLISEYNHTAIENIVLVEMLRQVNYQAGEKEKKRIDLLNESIQSLEGYVFTSRESDNELPKAGDDTKLEDMCMRINAITEAIMEKEKILTNDNSNANDMLEAALKQIKELKTGGRSMRKTRKNSQEIEITKDIVLDQTSDGSTYEIINKKGNLELELDDHSFVELKPFKTRKSESPVKSDSPVIDKLEIFDAFMDPSVEVNKRKILERLDSDLKKLENIKITVGDLKRKAGTEERKDEYETIKGQLKEAEEAIEKLFNVNRKLTTKAEKEKDGNRRRRILEQARRGSEKIGRLQLEIQRIQFLLMKLDGEKEVRAKSKISDAKSKVILRDYIYGVSRSVSMKKKRTRKRDLLCGCVQQPLSP